MNWVLLLNGMTANMDFTDSWLVVFFVEILGTYVGSLTLMFFVKRKFSKIREKYNIEDELSIGYFEVFLVMAVAMIISFWLGAWIMLSMNTATW